MRKNGTVKNNRFPYNTDVGQTFIKGINLLQEALSIGKIQIISGNVAAKGMILGYKNADALLAGF